jgi:hypothetical protein
LAETLTTLPVPKDSGTIKVEGLASDVLTLELSPPHSGPHPLDDEAALQLSDDPDDHDDRPAQWAAGVDLLAEADELYIQAVQLVQHFEEVLRGPGDPVASPHQDDVEAAAAGITHHGIESRPAGLRPGDPVGVLMDDLISALTGHLAEIEELGFGMLVKGRDPHI